MKKRLTIRSTAGICAAIGTALAGGALVSSAVRTGGPSGPAGPVQGADRALREGFEV